MLIDPFAENWCEQLSLRAAQIPPVRQQYLLLDGAFVPGLHTKIVSDRKSILFSALPGCTEESIDVSPFVIEFSLGDKKLRSLLQRCNRWPMVSVIETSESLVELGARLSAWCVIKADEMYFNFRFPDTRRLPLIFKTLDKRQRSQLAGPAVRWSYISRNGDWAELDVVASNAEIAKEPSLGEKQFANLVEDSQADEIMTLLSDRNDKIFQNPSRTHSLIERALFAAMAEKLADASLLDWCEHFWSKDELCEISVARHVLCAWRKALEK